MVLLKLVGFGLTACTLFWFEYLFEKFATWTSSIGSVFLVLLISWKLGAFLAQHLFIRRFLRVDPQSKAVLITGCDTGFGYLFAQKLNEKGFHVFAGCYFPDGEGAKSLHKTVKHQKQLTIIPMDVTKDESVNRAYTQVRDVLTAKGLRFWGLVNNAGVARCAEVEWGDLDTEYKATYEVNALGPVRVTRTFLPLLRKAGGGRIVNICSVAGRLTFPLFTAYSMSKHALISFTEGLRREVDKFDIRVVSIEPFIYKTPMIVRDMTASMDRSWEQTSNEIKIDYGQSYFNAINWYVKAFVSYYNPFMVRGCPDEVVQSVEEALMLTNPEHSYVNCSWFLWPSFWIFINVIPTDIFEFYMKYYTYVMKFMVAFFK